MSFRSCEDSNSSREDDSAPTSDDGYLTDATEQSISRADTNADNTYLADLLADNEHPPEYYIRQWQDGDESEYLKQDYSRGTTGLLDRIEEQWHQFANYIRQDPTKLYKHIRINLLRSFFDWLLNQKSGKQGRRLRGTKYKSSLGTYWKLYRLVFERATGNKIDGQINRSMHKVLRKLATKHGLLEFGREKPCMYVEDLKEVLRTNITTTKKRYKHGRLRMEIQLFMQLAGFTGNRPQALLELCYKHIDASLLRDHFGDRDHLLLEFGFEFTKSFLGAKDMNTFPIPEIVYDPSLIFSPHVILLGLVFDDQAFLAPSLTRPEGVSTLVVEPGKNQLPLHFKPDMADKPIFRSIVRTMQGWTVSVDKPLTYAVVRSSMRTLGQITGFKQVTRPYALRYGAGKAFNENGKVSEAMQNLMMQHADVRTFLRHYLHRRVTADTAAIVRGTSPQESIMRSACNMSRWIDPNRPWGLTAEQAGSVAQDPTIASLLLQRERLRLHLKGKACDDPLYTKLGRRIMNEKERLRRALLEEIQKKYELEASVRSIEQQLAGVKKSGQTKVFSYFSDDTLPEQRRLIETMILAPPGATIQEEFQRRDNAVNAVTAYCKIEEGDISNGQKRCGGRLKRPVIKTEHRPQWEDALKAAELSLFIKRPTDRPRRCAICLTNDGLPLAVRLYEFSKSSDLTKHFKRSHLSRVSEGQASLECKLCKMACDHKMHFQRHMLEIHGTVT